MRTEEQKGKKKIKEMESGKQQSQKNRRDVKLRDEGQREESSLKS